MNDVLDFTGGWIKHIGGEVLARIKIVDQNQQKLMGSFSPS